jgi:hypothetical protein
VGALESGLTVDPWPTKMSALSGLQTIFEDYGLETHKGRTERFEEI